MKAYGDIRELKGSEIPLVDIVTGGSPCQDLSVAGKRAGLAGERSGLFTEQVRIIKEMREKSEQQLRSRGTTFDRRYIQPRYMVWENVSGAFSSNKGEDFRIVLEETAKIADEAAIIPRPEKGKWTHSGCVVADGWSIAWRLHDAQYWGVPQRRKRICLVADFGGALHQKYYLNYGEKPLMKIVSKLSQILEINPDPKYNLSAKACQGILRRAENRGKELPKMLKEALERQAKG